MALALAQQCLFCLNCPIAVNSSQPATQLSTIEISPKANVTARCVFCWDVSRSCQKWMRTMRNGQPSYPPAPTRGTTRVSYGDSSLEPSNSTLSYGSIMDNSPVHRRRTLVATTNSGKQKDNTHINILAHHGTMQAKTAIALMLYV